jgi:hypothetical protein
MGGRGDRLGRACLNSPLYLGKNTYKCQGQTRSHLWHPGRRMLGTGNGTGNGTGTDIKRQPFEWDSTVVISKSRVIEHCVLGTRAVYKSRLKKKYCLHKSYGTCGY